MAHPHPIVRQVRRNCDIADAQHAGFYSVCGLALRLRDLYKWEHGLNPWEEDPSDQVLDWIGRKEQSWEELTETELKTIRVQNRGFDWLDSTGINRVLAPQNLYYGAGYAHALKPTFFVAEIERQHRLNCHTIYTLGRELARDLYTSPAMAVDNTIIVRRASARFYLWDQIAYVNQSGRKALSFSLAQHGISDPGNPELKQKFDRIVDQEIDTFIYHEIGELDDTAFDRSTWRAIVAAYPQSPIELLARSLKDILADTCETGRLAHILQHCKTASLGFYVAFLPTFIKKLFPQIVTAFQSFTTTLDWHLIRQARTIGYRQARDKTTLLIDCYRQGVDRNDTEWAAKRIERELLQPLGITN